MTKVWTDGIDGTPYLWTSKADAIEANKKFQGQVTFVQRSAYCITNKINASLMVSQQAGGQEIADRIAQQEAE